MEKLIEEDELVSRLQANERGAVEYLYKKYAGALLGVIGRIITDTDLAEEVFHDAFVKICQKSESYDPSKGRLYTWMANICRNSAIDKTRSKEFSKAGKTNTIDDFVYKIEADNQIESEVDFIGLKETLYVLNEEQRFIIDQIYFQGYTHSEVAEEFGIPLGTVKSRLRAALIVLRKKLGEIE